MTKLDQIKKGVQHHFRLKGKNPTNDYIIMAWNDFMIDTREDDKFFFWKTVKQTYIYKDNHRNEKKLTNLNTFFTKEIDEGVLEDFLIYLNKS